MASVRSLVCALGGALVLAGCGGHGSSGGPFASGGTSAPLHTQTTPGTTAPGASPAPAPGSTPASTPAPTPPPSPPAGPSFEVAAWVPYWTWAASDPQLAANVGVALDEVNLFGYSLQADGGLVAKNGVESAARIASIKARGGKVVSTVFDVEVSGALASVLADPVRQRRTIQAVVDAIDRNGLDGIDIDFEHATSSTRAAFTRFVADIGQAVRARGKLFSVTVPPKRADLPNWAGYDYAALGAAADRVKLMGYGVSGSWSAAGPTGPVGWLGQVVTYAKSVMPARKIQVGIPLYGIEWDAAGGTRNLVTWTAIQDRARQSTGGVRYDAASGESTFEYVNAQGLRCTVWFTEPQGVARKAQLARDEGLLGLTVWALGYGEQAHLDQLRAVLHPGR